MGRDDSRNGSGSAEMATFEAFSALDPIVRPLLAVVQRTHSNDVKARGAGAEERAPLLLSSDDDDLELTISLLRTERTLFDRLRTALLSLWGGDSGGRDGDNNRSAAAAELAEYVLLPSILVLQTSAGGGLADRRISSSSDDDADAMWSSVRSLENECAEGAALVVAAYIDGIVHATKERACTGPKDGAHPPPLSPKVVVRCLVACAMALELRRNEATGGLVSSEASDRSGRRSGDLDRGEGRKEAILRCVQSLCDLCAIDPSSSLAGAVAGALGRGALVVQLAQFCLDAMVPPPLPRATASKAIAAAERRRGGVGVQLRLQSISTLRAMMDGLPVRTLWRNLLPGCFSALFRVAVSQLQSSRGSTKIAVESLEALSRLLVLTLSVVDRGSSHDDASNVIDDEASSESRGGGGGGSGRQEDVLAQAAKLLQQVAAAEASGSPADDSGDGSSMSSSPVRSTPPTSELSTGPKGESTSSAPLSPTLRKEVNSRLPAPLSLLVNLSSTHSSVAVRRAGVALCATILVDTRDVWEEDESCGGLKRAALECCLVALNGDDDSITASSRSAVARLRDAFGPLLWKRELSDIVAPRIMELVEELPVLATSLRDREFKHRADLISGYLMMSLFEDRPVDAGAEGDWRSSSIQRSAFNGVGASLCCDSGSNLLLRSLAGVLELDLNAPPVEPVNGSLSLVEENRKAVGSTSTSAPSRYHFLHIRKESCAASVQRMLHLLGAVLGSQRCVGFVNTCVSRLSDGCASTTSKRALHGRGHVEWLRESTGLIVAANEVLVGAFGNKDHIEASLAKDSQDSSYKFPYFIPADTKFLRDALRFLLPVIFGFPLWNLPTTLVEVENSSSGNSKRRQSNDDALRHYFSESSSRTRSRRDVCCTTEVSASALHGNALIVSHLMTLVGTISDCLGSEMQEFLPFVLYPIVEKVDAHNNCQTVRELALATLARIAHATGKDSLAAFLASNLDYLVDAIVSRLHVAGNGCEAVALPHSLPGVVEVILRSTFVERSKSTNNSSLLVEKGVPPGTGECLSTDIHSSLWLIEDVIEALLRSFDRVVASATKLPKSEMNYLVGSMLRLFDVTIGCLRAALPGQDVVVGDGDCRQRAQKSVQTTKSQVWMECLIFEFGKEAGNRSATIDNEDEFAHLTPEEGFARYRMAKEKDSNEHDHQEESETSRKTTDSVAEIDNTGEIQIVDHIMSRCTFFLSFDNLSIQVAACDVLRKGFDYIASTESEVLTKKKEDGVTKRNQLRPMIHKLWSLIHARLVATSTILNYAKDGPSHTYFDPRRALCSPSEKDSKYATSAAFLDSLLTLFSSLCSVSGDFMRDRFERDVWPLMAKMLGDVVSRPHLSSEGFFLSENVGSKKGYCVPPTMPVGLNSFETVNGPSLPQRSYFNSDKRVVLAILSCISRVFASRECGRSLSHLVPSAGTIVLPFLSDEGAVGDTAVLALKSLLVVDCDSLWRGLLVMSGMTIAPNPLASRSEHSESQGAQKLYLAQPAPKPNGKQGSGHEMMKKRALHLIQFVDGLDEQIIS